MFSTRLAHHPALHLAPPPLSLLPIPPPEKDTLYAFKFSNSPSATGFLPSQPRHSDPSLYIVSPTSAATRPNDQASSALMTSTPVPRTKISQELSHASARQNANEDSRQGKAAADRSNIALLSCCDSASPGHHHDTSCITEPTTVAKLATEALQPPPHVLDLLQENQESENTSSTKSSLKRPSIKALSSHHSASNIARPAHGQVQPRDTAALRSHSASSESGTSNPRKGLAFTRSIASLQAFKRKSNTRLRPAEESLEATSHAHGAQKNRDAEARQERDTSSQPSTPHDHFQVYRDLEWAWGSSAKRVWGKAFESDGAKQTPASGPDRRPGDPPSNDGSFLSDWTDFLLAYGHGRIDLNQQHPQLPTRGDPDLNLVPNANREQQGPLYAPTPEWEWERQASLNRLEISKMPDSFWKRIKAICDDLRKHMGTMVAMFTVIDEDMNRVCCISSDGAEVGSNERRKTLCAHAIRECQ